MLFLNKIQHILYQPKDYNSDVVENTYVCLYELIISINSSEMKRIISHPIFNLIITLCNDFPNKNKGIRIFCGIINSCDELNLKLLINQFKIEIFDIFIENLKGHDHPTILCILKSVHRLC